MSAELIKRLQDERLRLWEEQKAALDKAEEAKRDLEGEEEQAWQRRNSRIDEIDERVKELVDGQQRADDAAAAFDRLLGTKRTAPPAAERDTNAQLRAFLRGEAGRKLEFAPATGVPSPVRRSAAESRDLLSGTPTAGGNTVPTSFYNQLVAHLIEVSGLLMAAPTVLTTESGEAIMIPKTTAHGGAALVTEGSPIPESDPTFAQARLDAYKYGQLLQISSELVDDTGVDLQGYIAKQAGRAVGNAIGGHLITGTGSGQPQGVVPAATVGVTGGTGVTGAFTADNIIDLQYSVIAPYRNSQSCSWLMRDATVGAARKLKDSTGQYLWQPALVAGAPDTLLGKPLNTDPFVPAVGLGNRSVLFGDFAAYYVRWVRGVRFERSDDYAFNQDLITYRTLLRGDGDLVDTSGAIKAFAGGAT